MTLSAFAGVLEQQHGTFSAVVFSLFSPCLSLSESLLQNKILFSLVVMSVFIRLSYCVTGAQRTCIMYKAYKILKLGP